MGFEENPSRDESLELSHGLLTNFRDLVGEQASKETAETLVYVAALMDVVDRVFIAGNGGSAATADHFASDLRDVGINAISLTENIASLTRIANDYSYTSVFGQQLLEFREKPKMSNDAFVAISVSGNSPNIIEAAKIAQGQRLTSVFMIGNKGGKVKYIELNTTVYALYLDSPSFTLVESMHSFYCHAVAEIIKNWRRK